MNAPTTGISKFSDQLLRPLFDKHVRSTTIIDGVDLIRRVETYVENDYLRVETGPVGFHRFLPVFLSIFRALKSLYFA